MYPIKTQIYCPSLREKPGELHALRSLDVHSQSHLLPLLVALPGGKKGTSLTLDDLIKREVGRVQYSWSKRVCLWDPQFLIPHPDDDAKDSSWIHELLKSFLDFDARVIPVVNLREKFHRASLLASHAARTDSGIALRISYDDIQDYALLESVSSALSLKPENTILVIDLSDGDFSAQDFARSLVGWLYEFKSRGNWAKIIMTGSSYPFKNPAPPKGEATSPRLEWQLWQETNRIDRAIRDFIIFGDYGADNANFRFEGGAAPIPHIRYATATDWRTRRGDSSYASIKEVCKKIIESTYFSGRNFSDGDEFIANCATGTNVGEPKDWRAANMSHHMMRVIIDLSTLYGLKVPDRRAVRPEQTELFPAK